jgi:hypothetical protein
LSHGTCSYIPVYINAVAGSVMLCLQHGFYKVIFKIKHKLCIASGSALPPTRPNEKFWVRACSQQAVTVSDDQVMSAGAPTHTADCRLSWTSIYASFAFCCRLLQCHCFDFSWRTPTSRDKTRGFRPLLSYCANPSQLSQALSLTF